VVHPAIEQDRASNGGLKILYLSRCRRLGKAKPQRGAIDRAGLGKSDKRFKVGQVLAKLST
jgi:hypothetical protein